MTFGTARWGSQEEGSREVFDAYVWDSVTPADELLESMSALVRAGKIRYWGISNSPAWYVAQVSTLAAEDEHLPLASKALACARELLHLAMHRRRHRAHRHCVHASRSAAWALTDAVADPSTW